MNEKINNSPETDRLTDELGEQVIASVVRNNINERAQHRELAAAQAEVEENSAENMTHYAEKVYTGNDDESRQALAYHAEVYKQRDESATNAVEDHLDKQRISAKVWGDVLAEQARQDAEAEGIHIDIAQPKE